MKGSQLVRRLLGEPGAGAHVSLDNQRQRAVGAHLNAVDQRAVVTDKPDVLQPASRAVGAETRRGVSGRRQDDLIDPDFAAFTDRYRSPPILERSGRIARFVQYE